MAPTSFPYPSTDAHRFAREGATADAASVARLRDEFARWLRRASSMDEDRLCDTVLAVNEALANAAEFAYLDGRAGILDFDAVLDHARRLVTVTVTDHGRWREANPPNRLRFRGRGIPLMRALADSLVIETSGLGTRVRLGFHDGGVAGRVLNVGV